MGAPHFSGKGATAMIAPMGATGLLVTKRLNRDNKISNKLEKLKRAGNKIAKLRVCTPC